MNELIDHLNAQIASAERLLVNVEDQTEAIKTQNVQGLLSRLGDVQTEMATRRKLEADRERLIQAAAARRNVPASAIDLEALLEGAPQAFAAKARELSAHLRGLLARVQRVHTSNRVLIRQELTFVNYLLGILSGVPQAGYSSGGFTSATRTVNSVDARA